MSESVSEPSLVLPTTEPSVRRPCVVAVGEVLWDMLPDDLQLGGAPLNFVWHAAALGSRALVLSRIGRDTLGERILDELDARSVSTALLQQDECASTGIATIDLNGDGEPEFHLADDSAWDFIEVSAAALGAFQQADAVYFGSLAQRAHRSRRSIQHLVAASRPDALRIFDANLRTPHIDREVVEASLELATVLKVNDAELPILAAMFDLPPDTLEAHARQLARRFDLAVVACTLGGCGSFILEGDRIDRHPGVPVEVVNTVGAGDAFTAALAMGLLAGAPLDVISATANAIAAHVCGHPGATPILPESLCLRFSSFFSDPSPVL